MTKPTEYIHLEMKTLNKSSIRSCVFPTNSSKTNADAQSEDVTTLRAPICLAKHTLKPTTKVFPHLIPLHNCLLFL